jgi:hypothetical protein
MHDHLVPAERFPILFTGVNRGMALLGLLPRWSWVEVGEERIRVRMSWAFRLDAPRATVADARRDLTRVWGWGAHGWGGRWLVNGSSSGLVRIDFEPRARGRVTGVPVRVRELRVSVEDPDGLVAALTRAGQASVATRP